MKKVVLHIEGMSCEECQRKLEKHLIKKKKILNAMADYKAKSLTVRYQDDLEIEEIEQYIEEIGFTSKGIDMLPTTSKISKGLLLIFGIMTIIVVYTVLANYFHLPIFSIFSMKKPKNYGITFLIITIIYLFYFQDILVDGLKRIITGRYNLNTVSTISILSAFFYSLYGVYRVMIGTKSYIHNTFFEIIIVMIYITKIARYIDGKDKKEIDREIKASTRASIQKVNRKTEDSYEEIPLEEVKDGDLLRCLPGDKVLVDGIVVEGNSYFDESSVTGESCPQEKKKDSKVISGSINSNHEIIYRVEKKECTNSLKQINKLVLDSKNKEKKYEKVIHKVGFITLPILMTFLVLFFFMNLIIVGSFYDSVTKLVKVLLVINPCVLVLGSSVGARKILKLASKKGLLIKKSESLEKVKTIDTILFDKTGTLTNGYLCISRINNHSDLEEKEILDLIGSMEKNSSNPIGRGITKYMKNEKIKTSHDLIIEDLNGYGVKAKEADTIYYACNSELLEKLDIINSYQEEERKMKKDGNTVLYLVKNNKVIATFGLKDIVKKEASKVINMLKEKKLQIKMLTGDNKNSAERIAKELEIEDYQSDLTILNKKEIVEKMIQDGKKVMYIGEGINDSPSLAASTIGITMKNGLDITKAASDIIFTNGNLFKIMDLFPMNKILLKNQKQNIRIYFLFLVLLLLGSFLFSNIPYNLKIFGILLANIILVIGNSIRIHKS